MIRPIALILFSLALLGCATSSPIKRLGESKSNFSKEPELIDHSYSNKDIYRIYHRAATGVVSIQSIRQSAEARADQFAKRQGKSFVVLGERISQPPYILGNFPRIEIVFALIDMELATPLTKKSKYDQLAQLKALLDDGAISNAEYEIEKVKILE